ncbi:MAG: EAL domain-containing protein, partial [Wenzhouxiangella sp.]
MSLERKLLLTIFVLVGLGVAVFQVLLYQETREQAEQDLLERAEQIRNVLMATRRVYHHQFIDSGIELTERTLGFLPAHAMSRISADFGNWDKSGLSFNNVSDDPRNPMQKADVIEADAIDHFRANPDNEYRFTAFDGESGQTFFHYAQPIWIEPYCLQCHGSQASAPQAIRAAYDSAYDYQVGDLKGILSIRVPAGQLEARVERNLIAQLGWGLVLLMLVVLAISWSIRRFVTIPLTRLGRGMERLAAGDLAHRIDRLHGEFQDIGETFNDMALRLDQSRRAISRSEERFRKLVETAQDGIMLTDQHGRILLCNDSAATIFGYRAEDLEGQPVDQLIPERHRDAHRLMLERLSRGEKVGHIGSMAEVVGLHRDGYEFPIEISPNSWQADDTRYHLAILRDITERKAAEQQLIDSERKFQTMIDWTRDWEYWILPDGSFHYTTPSVRELTGYDAGEFTADPGLLDRIIHPDDRRRWQDHLAEHVPENDDDACLDLELRLIRKDGAEIWIQHACRPVRGESGEYLGRRVSVRNITARKDAEQRAYHLAFHDALTDLPNRRMLIDRLERALARSRRSHEFGTVIMLDLDHFKKINDTRGHSLGDRVLVEVARRLTSVLREKDTVARLGGDEFIVVVEDLGTDSTTAAAHAERVAIQLRDALARKIVLDDDPTAYDVSASLGLALFGQNGDSVESLLRQADVAMYQAKDSGRDRLRFFNPEMQALVERRTALEQALKRALENDEFQLYYQPQVDRDGRWIGVEALLRWHDPDHGLISPGEFIPVAEQSGLIIQIGQWVMETACHQIRAWADDARTRAWTVAVNVSARQFHQDDFVDLVRAILNQTGADPARLKLELTEGIVLDNVDTVIERMHALAGLGVSFSLDDFGTGYSSLSYLKRLPIQQIKIDQS